MTYTQFQSVRNVLRWAGIGAMVSAQRVDEALKAVEGLPRADDRSDTLRAALMSLRVGAQLSQRDCLEAEHALAEVFRDDETESPRHV